MKMLSALAAGLLISSVFAADAGAAGHLKKGHGMMKHKMVHGKHSGMKKAGLEEKLAMKGRMILANAEKLDLTDGQAEKIRAILAEAKKKAIRTKADVEIIMVDVHTELHKKEPSKAALHELIEKKYAAKKTLTMDIFDAIVDLKASLSDDQKKSLKKLKDAAHGEGKHGAGWRKK